MLSRPGLVQCFEICMSIGRLLEFVIKAFVFLQVVISCRAHGALAIGSLLGAKFGGSGLG